MSDLDGQNVRQFRARGAGVTRMSSASEPGVAGETNRPIRRLAAPITQPFPVASDHGQAPDEHVDDLIPAYALGALDADERVAVERHASYCPTCARQLADMRRTATMLPFSVATAAPSPDVKAALFARIAHSTAPVTAENAEEYQWARPVQAKPQVTLPSSGTWLDSQTFTAVTPPAATAVRKPRRSIGRALGISVPVFLTFGLLALFVIPQMLPSDDSNNQDFIELLGNTAADCTGEGNPLVTSTGIVACGYVQPSTTANLATVYVSNLIDSTVREGYVVNLAEDGSYRGIGPLTMTGPATGELQFSIPAGTNANTARLCITGADEDPNLVCTTDLTPAA
ncbi:MAG TPA: zf-HC2 domain-containing protein [Thermomicrobiales bacterium]|nr:zf-HC2 domain-containing protein [Thermomicrobiales bacterium]